MVAISLFYRECVGVNAIRLALRVNTIVGNIKKITYYSLPSKDDCFVCNKKDSEHGSWNYIYSWFFTDEKNIHLIITSGFKIMTTYYENSKDYTSTIISMKYISHQWIACIRKSLGQFQTNIKHNKNKTQYLHMASLVVFENEMNKIISDMKIGSNIKNPYINHNPYGCTGFIHKNVTHNRHVNYVSKNQIVILSTNKNNYQTLWNITNTLQSLITSLEQNKYNHNDITTISFVAYEYQESFKQVSSTINKQDNDKKL